MLARSPSFSREIQAAKMFKSPARTPDLICFYSSRDCLVVVSLYHTQSWPFPPVEREASQRKRAGTASSLRDSLLLPPLLHGGPDVRTRDRTWAEPGKHSAVPEGASALVFTQTLWSYSATSAKSPA